MQLYVLLRRNGWRSPEDLQAAGTRSAAEAERRDDVRWIRSFALEESAELGTVCISEAESPEAIRDHAAAAGLPITKIVRVADTVIVRPDPPPPRAQASRSSGACMRRWRAVTCRPCSGRWPTGLNGARPRGCPTAVSTTVAWP
jgi:hypothetical protein